MATMAAAIALRSDFTGADLRRLARRAQGWLFAGSDRGGERAAAMYSLIATACGAGASMGRSAAT
jgi:hypothetical protein